MDTRIMAFCTGLAALLLSLGVVAPASAAGYKPEERYSSDADGARAYQAPRKLRRKAPHRHCCEGYDFVYAESWQGFKKVVAPVRKADLGYQVRLPSGNWVYCEFSCEYTLRKQSLDIWDAITPSGAGVSPGLFRKDFYLDDLGRRRY